MDDMDDEETVDDPDDDLIPGGFFQEDEKTWKDLDAIYGGRTIKNELKYTNEEVKLNSRPFEYLE